MTRQFAALRTRAVEMSETILAHPPVVMKDPRLCLTLPLWRRALARDPVAILVYRDPVEVALSRAAMASLSRSD